LLRGSSFFLYVADDEAGVARRLKGDAADVSDLGFCQHIHELFSGVGLAGRGSQQHVECKQGRMQGAVHGVVEDEFVDDDQAARLQRGGGLTDELPGFVGSFRMQNM